MLEVKSVDEVFRIIKENFSGYGLETETISIDEAAGRTAAADMAANEDIPGFDRSSVDGYAVISKDTFGASESLPAQLRIIGEVRMGERPDFSLEAGQAAYVPTGGELPRNADAMVMIEYTENLEDGFIYIEKASAPGNHVVFRGDDIKEGSTAVKAGACLRPQDIGVLAGLGYTAVPVRRKLRAGIISTGDEVVDIRERPAGSQVRDINAHMLYAGLVGMGISPKPYGIVRDDFISIRNTVENALHESDIVIISGGSSVGTKDVTCKVIDSLGSPGVLIQGIAVKPGKPTIIGRIGDKAVIGLPGHPASAYSIFNIFVGYLAKVMSGRLEKSTPAVVAEMSCKYPSNNGREEYLPVRLRYAEDKLYADPVFGKSGLITLLTEADGYVHINRGSEGIDRGAAVDVVLF